MKQILYSISIVLLAISATSCSINGIKGSGVIVTNEINITDFRK